MSKEKKRQNSRLSRKYNIDIQNIDEDAITEKDVKRQSKNIISEKSKSRAKQYTRKNNNVKDIPNYNNIKLINSLAEEMSKINKKYTACDRFNDMLIKPPSDEYINVGNEDNFRTQAIKKVNSGVPINLYDFSLDESMLLNKLQKSENVADVSEAHPNDDIDTMMWRRKFEETVLDNDKKYNRGELSSVNELNSHSYDDEGEVFSLIVDNDFSSLVNDKLPIFKIQLAELILKIDELTTKKQEIMDEYLIYLNKIKNKKHPEATIGAYDYYTGMPMTENEIIKKVIEIEMEAGKKARAKLKITLLHNYVHYQSIVKELVRATMEAELIKTSIRQMEEFKKKDLKKSIFYKMILADNFETINNNVYITRNADKCCYPQPDTYRDYAKLMIENGHAGFKVKNNIKRRPNIILGNNYST